MRLPPLNKGEIISLLFSVNISFFLNRAIYVKKVPQALAFPDLPGYNKIGWVCVHFCWHVRKNVGILPEKKW